MKVSKYRIGARHYKVGEFMIYGVSRSRWQVCKTTSTTTRTFRTLREAIRYAQFLRDLPLTRNVKPTPLPVDLVELRVMLTGPQS